MKITICYLGKCPICTNYASAGPIKMLMRRINVPNREFKPQLCYENLLHKLETAQMWVVAFSNAQQFFQTQILQINTCPTCKDISGTFAQN